MKKNLVKIFFALAFLFMGILACGPNCNNVCEFGGFEDSSFENGCRCNLATPTQMTEPTATLTNLQVFSTLDAEAASLQLTATAEQADWDEFLQSNGITLTPTPNE